ncbi:hypothetical protein BaRGS_00016685, partial [Batillaria attramentaria]
TTSAANAKSAVTVAENVDPFLRVKFSKLCARLARYGTYSGCGHHSGLSVYKKGTDTKGSQWQN